MTKLVSKWPPGLGWGLIGILLYGWFVVFALYFAVEAVGDWIWNTDLLDSTSSAKFAAATVTALLVGMVFYALGAIVTHHDDREAAREILSAVEGDEESTSPYARASVKQLGERMDNARWFRREP